MAVMIAVSHRCEVCVLLGALEVNGMAVESLLLIVCSAGLTPTTVPPKEQRN